ncbi:GPI anchored dioxygenase [Pseudozyma hubeiensis]|nr:GPI anchored dioxygenase [Pseudozyma hubeiensis]
MQLLPFLPLLAAALTVVVAHPGHAPPSAAELQATRSFKRSTHQRYSRCASTSSIQRRHALHSQTRRQQLLSDLRTQVRRNSSNYASTVLETDHHSNRTDLTSSNATTSAVFASNSSSACVLQPEVTIGPYWVSGELLRSNLTDDQPGVPLYLDVQFVNVDTCQPVPELFWEVWNCNSTGVYSGVTAAGNGNSDDTSNLNATFLRGVQQTDSNGASQFTTIFPGHYTGRATHIHVVAHANATLLPNNTLSGGGADGAIHIGQLFFDQDLISQVEAVQPYSTNTQNVTSNADDSIFAEEASSQGSDPVLEYVLLGDSVEDGIFAWTTIAVDVGAEYTTSAAATWTDDGGVANESSQGQGPGGAPPS